LDLEVIMSDKFVAAILALIGIAALFLWVPALHIYNNRYLRMFGRPDDEQKSGNPQ